ncbi:MAG: hypothetical protein HYR91_03970 [Flavobacteriia bacterium]|nr:hypothetical protein [Flavobacteriia bacterium]
MKNNLGYYLVICLFIFLIFFFAKKSGKIEVKSLIQFIQPIVLLPLFLFISIESEFFFKLKYNTFLPYKYLFLGLLLSSCIIYFLSIYRYKKLKKAKNILEKLFLPASLFCIILLTSYHPFIEEPTEMFEAANPANALLRIFQFREIPFVDFLSSHMFSEQFFGLIHSWIFGFDKHSSFMTYGFIYEAIYLFLAYILFKRIFNNGIYSFIFILFFPYFTTLIHTGLFFSIIAFFQVIKVIKNQSVLNYSILIFCVIGLIFWRLDTGAASLFSLIAFVPILYYVDRIKIQFSSLLKACGYFLLLTIAITSLILVYIQPTDLISNIKSALHYTSANQAHGYPNIVTELNQQFLLYHVTFPIIAVLIILYIVYYLRQNQLDGLNSYSLKASLFLLIVFIANFQRGLVRHNFMEGNESFLISTFYIGISLFLLSMFHLKNEFTRFTILFTASFTIIVGLKYFPLESQIKTKAELLLSEPTIKNLDLYFNNQNFKGKSIINQNFRAEKLNDFAQFLNQQLKPNQSFFDFSNTPMLYYYTGRKVPSYFCQNLQNTIDDYLQLEQLKTLNTKDFPIVVYSNYPKTWYDETDGVSNSMRHYLIAEYIYKNYKPIGVLNQHSIWLAKDQKLRKSFFFQKDTISEVPQINNYQRAAYYMNLYFLKNKQYLKKQFFIKPYKTDSLYTYFKVPKLSKNNGYMLKLRSNATQLAREFKVELLDASNSLIGTNLFYSTPEAKEYLIRWGNHYLIHLKKARYIRVSKFDLDKIINLEFYLDER